MEVADVFRTEWPRLVATLVRDVGDLTIAEDAAQDAFVEASTRWPTDGVPERPGAWLVTTGRRKAIDQIRRLRRFEDRLAQLAADLPEAGSAGGDREHVGARPAGRDGEEALDDQLALVVGCCHPALAPEAQVALTLRLVAGLSTPQIARAFLVSEETMTRRLSRAKAKIRAAKIPFEPPDVDTLTERLGTVCDVISAIFTEAVVGFGVAIPSAPGFVGTFHASADFALSDVYGVAAPDSLAFAFGYHFGGWVPITLIGLWYAWRLGLSLGDVGAAEERVEEVIEEEHPGALPGEGS